MNDEQYFLANAYVDGELTDDERRIAEADPAVMAEVEVLRELQAELRSVEVPSANARESAIGAAMAAFAERSIDADVAAATAAATTVDPVVGAPVVPFRPKPAYSRWLGAAAAVVAVGLLGVVIVNGVGGGDDDDTADLATASVEDATEQSADRSFIESEDDAADAGGDDGDMAADEPASELAEADDMAEDEMSEQMAEEAAEEPADDADTAADEEMAEEDTNDSGVDEGTAAPEARADLDPAYDSQPPVIERPEIDVEADITNDAELGAYGTYLLELQIDGRLPPTPNTECDPIYNILDDAPVVVNGVLDDRHIAVQEDEARVVAIDRDDCLELVDGPLFEPFGP